MPPPSLPHSPPCSQSMKTLLLLPAFSLLLLHPLAQGFRPIQLKTTSQIKSDETILDVVKQGLTNQEAKQILMQLFRTSLHDRYMKESGKGFALKLKMADLVKLFSEKTKANKKKNTSIEKKNLLSFMSRIQ